jgi:Skp family chaperone for outer membrane proteins
MRLTFAVSILALTAATAAQADVYRFVDAQGRIQYTDRWIPGSELIKSSDHNRASNAAAAQARATEQNKLAVSNDRIAAQQAQTAATTAIRQEVAAARNEQCKTAKDKYEKAIQARRLYKTGKDGERQYLTDQESDEARLAARVEMQSACGTDKK